MSTARTLASTNDIAVEDNNDKDVYWKKMWYRMKMPRKNEEKQQQSLWTYWHGIQSQRLDYFTFDFIFGLFVRIRPLQRCGSLTRTRITWTAESLRWNEWFFWGLFLWRKHKKLNVADGKKDKHTNTLPRVLNLELPFSGEMSLLNELNELSGHFLAGRKSVFYIQA